VHGESREKDAERVYVLHFWRLNSKQQRLPLLVFHLENRLKLQLTTDIKSNSRKIKFAGIFPVNQNTINK